MAKKGHKQFNTGRTWFEKGMVPWNKGKKCPQISKSLKGRHLNPQTEFRVGHSQLNTGRTWIKKGTKLRLGTHHTEESKRKLHFANLGKMPPNLEFLRTYKRPRGKDSPLWKGGIDESSSWRGRVEWRLWRESVFARDNWTCQKCGISGGKLHPHHIKTFKDNLDCRFAIDNGITFCIACHRLFHKKYGRINIGKEQIYAFIKNN